MQDFKKTDGFGIGTCFNADPSDSHVVSITIVSTDNMG